MDNLWHIVDKFKKATKLTPLLSYDNVRIQEAVDISLIKYAQGEEDKEVYRLNKTTDKVDLPTYSPDMNRAIEHVFGEVKPRVRVQLYRGVKDFTKGIELQRVVWAEFKHLKKGAVAADVKGLPLLWRVLSTPEGTAFEYPPGHKHVGTGGAYAPARYC